MADESLEPLSPEQLAELDAAYVPFPSFDQWPTEVPNLVRWIKSCEEFQVEADAATAADIARARDIALRAAAFDTGAIEGLYSTNRGLTFSVAEQAAAWEKEVEAQGPDTRALFEAQLRAFELILDLVTDSIPQITQAWVRRLHEETTAAQEKYLVHTPVGPQEQPLPRGRYKEYPNHVRTSDGGVHAYAPVGSTQSEMQRFLGELETAAFAEAHPIIQASYAHYALVAIHPFADGNGRVARALASVYTYRAASVPLLILSGDRNEYFKALARADAGKPKAFIGFIANAAWEAVELTKDNLRTAQAPQPEAMLRKFDELNRVDRRSKERDLVANELVAWLQATIAQRVESLDDSESVKLTVAGLERARSRPPDGYRRIAGNGVRSIRLMATSIAPKKMGIEKRIDVFVSDDPNSDDSLYLQTEQAPRDHATFGLSELWPSASTVAEHRLDNFVRRVLGSALEVLHEEALMSLKRSK